MTKYLFINRKYYRTKKVMHIKYENDMIYFTFSIAYILWFISINIYHCVITQKKKTIGSIATTNRKV